MKNFPALFFLFCLGVLGLLSAADLYGYGVAGLFARAASAPRFASHYHK